MSRSYHRRAASSPRRRRPRKWCNTGREFSIASPNPPVGNSTLEQNQFEDGYLKGPPLSKFFDELTVLMRDVLKEAGAKVVR